MPSIPPPGAPAALARGRTWSRMRAACSTSDRLLAMRAPLSLKAPSGKPAAAPAPDSITTSSPALARRGKAEGTTATRRSPGNVSLRTPAIIGS
jgi:hypothetical protein